jgi:hypothetical protein
MDRSRKKILIKVKKMIHKKALGIMLVIMSVFGSFWASLNTLDALAQAPPYPPLKPSTFKVIKTSWIDANETFYATPGDTNIPLYVGIQNIGNRTATGLSETLLLQHPFTNASGGNTVNTYYENNVDQGLTAITKFILNIDRDAEVGMHTLTMHISYLQIVSGTGTTLYLEQQTEVEVPVLITDTSYLAIYSVSLYPTEVSLGGNITISGNVVNTAASTMSNLNISVSSSAFLRQPFVFIGQTDPNIPRPFSFTMQVRSDLQNGTIPILISATFSDSYDVNHVTSTSISTQVAQRAAAPIRTSTPREPVQVIIDSLREIVRFFFGY